MEEGVVKREHLFGTDGIRGTPGVYPLTDGMVFKIGKAVAKFLLKERNKGGIKVVIGKDSRESARRLEIILANAISSSGVETLLVGIVPTPAISFFIKKLNLDFGIMITASHNRPQDNGIKFFSNDGQKLLPAQEDRIEELVFSSLINFNDFPYNSNRPISKLDDAQRSYIDFVKSTAGGLDLEGFKIAVDCAWGSLSEIAPLVFIELGASVYSINNEFKGENINLNCGALFPQAVATLLKEKGADVGFAFDGDGDRVILVDEKGEVLCGDYILAIAGLYLLRKNKLSKNTVVATVMSNYGLEMAIKQAGGEVLRTPVGDRFVSKELLSNRLTLGGEQSGHIIFSEYTSTPDALITSLQILKIMKEMGKKLSEIASSMKKYPQILINMKVREKVPFEKMESVYELILASKKKLKGNGRLLVRYSGTEPLARIMVEGKDKFLIENIAVNIANKIKEVIGVGDDSDSIIPFSL